MFNQQQQPYFVENRSSQAAALEGRAKFIERTYLHLAGAIAVFVAAEAALLSTPFAKSFTIWALGGRWNWLLVIGAWMLIGKLASGFAHGGRSKGAQYAGLGLYTIGQAILFVPLLTLAQHFGGPDVIANAGMTTLAVFAGLTGFVLYTKRDFSFLRGILAVGAIGSLMLVVLSLLFGFGLGTFFTVFMVVLAAGFVLYDTSNVLRHFHEDQYVGAALELFASVALMFWYIVQLFMSRE